MNFDHDFTQALMKDTEPRRPDPLALKFIEKTLLPRFKARRSFDPLRILEVGPGLSTVFSELPSLTPALEVLSIDSSTVAIEFLQAQTIDHPYRQEFRCQDILTLNEEKFDLIIDLSLLHCLSSVSQQQEYLQVMKNHLQSDGLLFLQTMVMPKRLALEEDWYFEDFTKTVFYQDRPYRLLCEAFDIEKNLTHAGLKIDYFRVFPEEKLMLSKGRANPMATDPDLLRVIAGL